MTVLRPASADGKIVEFNAERRSQLLQRRDGSVALPLLDLRQVAFADPGFRRKVGEGQAAMLAPGPDRTFAGEEPIDRRLRQALLIPSAGKSRRGQAVL